MKKSEETEQKILESTIEAISEKGYAPTTTKEIADRAGVSEGTIFKYYGSKKDLLRKIVDSTIKDLRDYSVNEAIPEVFAQAEEMAPQELLYQLMQERAGFFRKHSLAMQVIIQEMMIDETIRDTFKDEVWGEMKKVSDRIFTKAKRMGTFKEVDNRTLRRVIFGSFFFQVIFEGMLEVNEGKGEPTEEEVKKTLEVLFAGISNKQEIDH